MPSRVAAAVVDCIVCFHVVEPWRVLPVLALLDQPPAGIPA